MEPNSMADLQSAVTAFSNSWLPVVSGLAAVGVIAMALIELLKSVFNLRRQYQRYAFKKWLDGQSAKFAKNFAEIDAPQSKIALAQIVGLATGGDENSLFDLKIDRFAGQLNAAVQVMLAYPANFKDGIKILAVSASEADLKAFLNGPAANADADARRAYAEIRTRISNVIQRNLDAIQISVGKRWERWLHVASIVVSVILILAFFRFDPPGFAAGNKMAIGSLILFALLGGMVAPVASNLVAALKKAKGT